MRGRKAESTRFTRNGESIFSAAKETDNNRGIKKANGPFGV